MLYKTKQFNDKNPMYPPKFKRQYKGVKFEHDGNGSLIFNRKARLKDMHDRIVWAKNEPISKEKLLNYARNQIDLNPSWIEEAKDPRNL